MNDTKNMVINVLCNITSNQQYFSYVIKDKEIYEEYVKVLSSLKYIEKDSDEKNYVSFATFLVNESNQPIDLINYDVISEDDLKAPVFTLITFFQNICSVDKKNLLKDANLQDTLASMEKRSIKIEQTNQQNKYQGNQNENNQKNSPFLNNPFQKNIYFFKTRPIIVYYLKRIIGVALLCFVGFVVASLLAIYLDKSLQASLNNVLKDVKIWGSWKSGGYFIDILFCLILATFAFLHFLKKFKSDNEKFYVGGFSTFFIIIIMAFEGGDFFGLFNSAFASLSLSGGVLLFYIFTMFIYVLGGINIILLIVLFVNRPKRDFEVVLMEMQKNSQNQFFNNQQNQTPPNNPFSQNNFNQQSPFVPPKNNPESRTHYAKPRHKDVKNNDEKKDKTTKTFQDNK